MPRLRHLVQYLAFVGVPLLGLLGVLRVGRDLAAPMAVYGSYAVGGADGRAEPCLRGVLADSAIAVAQSGTLLDIRLAHGVRLAGHLAADRFSAAGVLPAIPGCAAGAALGLEALAVRTGRRIRLAGELRAACPGCGTLAFEASLRDGPTVAGR